MREELVFESKVTSTELQDRLLQWGQITKEEHGGIFKVQQEYSRPYEFNDNVHISISFELNLDLTHIDRQAYHVLDLLGDVGGLGEALMYIFTFMLAFINYGKFDTMMYRYIFMTTKDSAEPSSRDDGNDG